VIDAGTARHLVFKQIMGVSDEIATSRKELVALVHREGAFWVVHVW